jgi:four helix bundle protein
MGGNIVLDKSKAFAVRIVKLYQYLTDSKKEFVLSKQLLRSGTSIGANVREAHNSQSKREFVAKMNIALKEASESEYWLELLHETGYLSEAEFNSIMPDCGELNRLLISIIKTSNKSTN